jgi:hypothetical protein
MTTDNINKFVRSFLAIFFSIAFIYYIFKITFDHPVDMQVTWVVLGYVSGLASGVASFYFGSSVIEAGHKEAIIPPKGIDTEISNTNQSIVENSIVTTPK